MRKSVVFIATLFGELFCVYLLLLLFISQFELFFIFSSVFGRIVSVVGVVEGSIFLIDNFSNLGEFLSTKLHSLLEKVVVRGDASLVKSSRHFGLKAPSF